MNDQISFSRYKYKEIKYTLYLRFKCKGIDVVVWTTFNFSSAPAGVRIWLNLGMAVFGELSDLLDLHSTQPESWI